MSTEKKRKIRCLVALGIDPSLQRDPKNDPRRRIGKLPKRPSGKRTSFFGIETNPELVWQNWEEGKEYNKTLVLVNIQNKLHRLHVRPPVSKCFTTSIAPDILLSPGTSLSIQITFTPKEKCQYEDKLEFRCKDGTFRVRLLAPVPVHDLDVPDTVALPLCAVQHSSETTFLLKNASKLLTSFRWEYEAPFQLSPERGLLNPDQEYQMTVVFRPQEAQSYQKPATCNFGDEGREENCCTLLLQGQAKNTCLQLRGAGVTENEKEHGHPVLLFGPVGFGQSLLKHFEIFNPSPVTAAFSLSHLSGGLSLLGSVFSSDVTSGEVPPGGSQRVGVTYSPVVVDYVSVEYLSLKCRGAPIETLIKLTGRCTGPKVSLSSSTLNFGFVRKGEAVKQTLRLQNSSSVATVYQWDLDFNGHSVFTIQPASGTVQPQNHIKLTVVYRPTQTIFHYRRVTCLILHGDPLFLDLNGSCHSEENPAPVVPPPDSCDQRLHRIRSVLKTPMDEFYQCYTRCIPSPHVCVAPSELLFNQKTTKSVVTSCSSTQSVAITNHTRKKVSLVWTIAEDSPFSISPVSQDLAPLKATSFRVTYDPKEPNTLHGAQLECFAFHKMDDPDLMDQLFCPSWCMTVRVIGHSFQPTHKPFEPSCSLEPPYVVFPGLNALSYRMVLLRNMGDLPLTFSLDNSSKNALTESVSVIPKCGLIQPKNYQILTLRTKPTEDSPNEGFGLQLQLNAAKFTKELMVVSAIEKLNLFLDGDCRLNFPPTSIGSICRRFHNMRNLSCIPLRFQWSIPEQDQELISVEPDAGELNPNEISVQTWSFRPPLQNTYTLEPTVTFWPVQSDGRSQSYLTLKVVGAGAEGFIEAMETVLDVEETLIGSSSSVEVPLVNNSPCSLSFCLSVHQTLLDEDLEYDPETEPVALQLDCGRGTIAPYSTMLLRCTVRPYRRAQYLCQISYQTLNASDCAVCPLQELCEVRVRGVVPTLQVTDVYGCGSIDRMEKRPLWKLLSLDGLNSQLLSIPTAAELTYGIPNKHCLGNIPTTDCTIFDFNFNAAPMNAAPSSFLLMFHNPGFYPVDWGFLFPDRQQMSQLDYWTETGAFSSSELTDMKDQNKNLFSISPLSGTLLPGQKKAVRFCYSHNVVGMNRIPVVFTQCHGREILLIFKGLTVDRDKPYLHYSSNKHVLTAVSIANSCPPRQVLKLQNTGALPVHYEVDTDVLLKLQMDNFNHAVLTCLNPEGDVPAGQSAMVEWIFSPLEAKLYSMEIPIHVRDGDTTLLTFEGTGFSSHIADSPETFYCSDVEAPLPCVQRIPFPGQVLFMSEESISLGNICISSQYSTILFLTNVSPTDSMVYTWEVPQQNKQEVVQIRPGQGSVSPGESALCVVTFTSTDYPTIYQLDVVCQVVLEVEQNKYLRALRRWEEEMRRKEEDFTITDRKETRAERERKAKLERQPKPPLPSLLHLEVTALSHRLQQCMQPPLPPSENLFPITSHPEKELVVDLLNTMLWNILQELDYTTLEQLSKPANHIENKLQPQFLQNRAMAEMSKNVLLNTLQNLMMEAVRGELDLTAHPRAISLPPAFNRRISKTLTKMENSKKD